MKPPEASPSQTAAPEGTCLYEDFHFLRVQLMRPSVASAVWDLATREKLEVFCPIFAEGVLRLFTRVDQKPDWDRSLTQLAGEGYIESYRFEPEIAPLVISSQSLDKVTETLAHSHILVTMGAALDGRVVLAVDRKFREEIREMMSGFLR